MPFGPLVCEHCGKDYMVNVSRRLKTSRFCSILCRARGIGTPEVNAKKAHWGPDHPRFLPVGTRRIWNGMPGVMVKTEDGWEREHRVVANAPRQPRHKKRLVVHHIDGDPTNNAPENLMRISQALHVWLHDDRERDELGRFK